MEERELLHETAMVAAIMADGVVERLYSQMEPTGKGYIDSISMIADWALEFMDLHKSTNWKRALENGIEPMSGELHSIICWDDCVFDYAYYKLSLLSSRN